MGALRELTFQAVDAEEVPTIRVSGVFGGEITGASVTSFIEYANKTEGAAKIILDSVGGDPAEAFHIYDFVRANALKLYVDIYGRCASAATIVAAAAGAKRTRISPNAEFLIHEARGGSAEELESVNQRIAKVYVELTGMSMAKVRQIMKADTVQDAQWAKDNGFVGSIIKLDKLAAKAEPKNMSKHTFKVDRLTTALQALMGGEVTIEGEVIETDAAKQLEANAAELKEKTDKLAELEAEVTKLKEGLEAKTLAFASKAKEAEGESAKVKEAETVTAELKKKVEAMEKTIETVRKIPAVAQILSNGQEAQVPGAGTEGGEGTGGKRKYDRAKQAELVTDTLKRYSEGKLA